MEIRETVQINADAQTVWALVADPSLHVKWNLKVVDVQRGATGPVHRGERFEMTYRMSGRDRVSTIEVTECEPPRRVSFFHRTTVKGREQSARETYELTPASDSIELTQTIDMSGMGIPWPFRLLIRFIHRFGIPTGEPSLAAIKRIAEGERDADSP